MDSCTFAVPIPAPLAGAEIVIHGVCVVAVHVHPAPERNRHSLNMGRISVRELPSPFYGPEQNNVIAQVDHFFA
jgi:hypothetical protein